MSQRQKIIFAILLVLLIYVGSFLGMLKTFNGLHAPAGQYARIPIYLSTDRTLNQVGKFFYYPLVIFFVDFMEARYIDDPKALNVKDEPYLRRAIRGQWTIRR